MSVLKHILQANWVLNFVSVNNIETLSSEAQVTMWQSVPLKAPIF